MRSVCGLLILEPAGRPGHRERIGGDVGQYLEKILRDESFGALDEQWNRTRRLVPAEVLRDRVERADRILARGDRAGVERHPDGAAVAGGRTRLGRAGARPPARAL